MAFKIGDRVRVYGWVRMHQSPFTSRQGGTGSIIWVDGQDMHVKFDRVSTTGREDLTHYLAHPKQCRRLVKRERRRVWIKSDDVARALHPSTQVYPNTILRPSPASMVERWVEFIEVRRKQ